jgi:mono/diheme cytochrome c family protein
VAVVLLRLAVPPAATAGDVSGAQLAYTLECQGCHRADGSGTPGSVPALAGSAGRFLRVPGGREYLARVPGVAQAPLDDARTAAVLTWVLQHFSAAELPADFTPYSGDEISRLRKTPLLDVEKERAKLLAALAAGAGR